MEIKKVLINKISGQKFVIIPKHSEIKHGDYVQIDKVNSEINIREVENG